MSTIKLKRRPWYRRLASHYRIYRRAHGRIAALRLAWTLTWV